ncbi:MAG: hypothetical protein KIT60_30280 [Burkholderiaceae bacterium]|nr:hypothetical protein [Burkholderiaceae bacterium]
METALLRQVHSRGHRFRCGATVALVLLLLGCRERVIYEGEGISVPRDFGCWHDVGYVVNWPKLNGQDLYHGPDPAFRVRANRVRLYGMGGLEWNHTEKAPGEFDWSRWDEAFQKLRSTGVRHVTLNLYNPPAFAVRRRHDYAGWRMQLPREREMLWRWLSAVTSRYAEIDAIEVANEVFTPGIGDNKSYFAGSSTELEQLADWTLDWRAHTRWGGQVWAPSIPGVGPNVEAMLEWLRRYPRAREFNAFPLHLYRLTEHNVGKRTGRSTAWTALVEFREGLQALNLGPVIDSEKGFDPGDVQPGTLYNYAVAALVHGVQQTCYFSLGSYGHDETNLGQPFRNAWAKDDLEAVAALAGRVITRVETTPKGRWSVTTQPAK